VFSGGIRSAPRTPRHRVPAWVPTRLGTVHRAARKLPEARKPELIADAPAAQSRVAASCRKQVTPAWHACTPVSQISARSCRPMEARLGSGAPFLIASGTSPDHDCVPDHAGAEWLAQAMHAKHNQNETRDQRSTSATSCITRNA
jgi:hypothetical protein